MESKKTIQIGIRLPTKMVEEIDAKIKDGQIANRSDYVKMCVLKQRGVI